MVWGSTFVFTKVLLLGGLTAAQIFLLRFIIAYVLLFVWSATMDKDFRFFAATLRDELHMLLLGITGGSLYFLTENTALNYTTTTNTSLIVCLCPLFTAFLVSRYYRSQRLRPIQAVGSVIAAVGVTLVVLNGRFVLHLSPKGDLLAFAACLCWALYSLLMIPANRLYNVTFITRKVFFYGLVSIIPYFMVNPEWPDWASLLRPSIMANLLFLGVVASLVCFLLWNWLMKKIGAVTTTNYVYLNPVATIVFAWLILSEKITPWFLSGTALILLGLFLADRRKTGNG